MNNHILRLAKANIAKSALLMSALLAQAVSASACDCQRMTAEQAYQQAAAVVIAEMHNAPGENKKRSVAVSRLKVLKTWKADVYADELIAVDIGENTDCRWEFKNGGKYLLFLRNTPAATSSAARYFTFQCAGGGPVERMQSEIAWTSKQPAHQILEREK